MKQDVCDHCRKVVNIYEPGSIYGDAELHVAIARSGWRKIVFGKYSTVSGSGVWRNWECLVAWFKNQCAE